MKLYKQENEEIVFLTQNHDPFFQYLTHLITHNMYYKRNARVLDLGCGGGRNLVQCAKMGFQAIGVDRDSLSLRVAKSYITKENVKNNVKLIQKDLEKFNPKVLGEFDYCILQEVIEHVEDYQRLIDKAYSALKKGGILFITTPHDPNLWNQFDVYADHIRRFKVSEVKHALHKFKNVEIQIIGFPLYRFSTFLYLQILKMRKQNHKAKNFRGNKIVHLMYYWIGKTILKIDSIFGSTPWGTTIFAIARK